jgi:hypothetical protein
MLLAIIAAFMISVRPVWANDDQSLDLKQLEAQGSGLLAIRDATKLIKAGDLDGALKNVENALIYNKTAQDNTIESWAYALMGRIYLEKSDKVKGCSALRKAEKLQASGKRNDSFDLSVLLRLCP